MLYVRGRYRFSGRLGRLDLVLLLVYLCDRVLRILALWSFFRRTPPKAPERWPAVTLLHPISRGASGLEEALRSRLVLDYPAPVQHIMICDEADASSIATCRALLAAAPAATGELIVVPTCLGPVAPKIVKLQAGLACAQGEVLCFVDDDVALRSATLRTLIPYLDVPRTGAVFGLACYVGWDTLWSSLMSAFVNANALLSYVPVSFLAEPWTITGHCYAVKCTVFEAAGGFGSMSGRLDDDHELARRLRRIGLRSVQTPLIYDVRNDLPTLRAYRAQMKRWFVFPRQAMIPAMSVREQMVALVGSLANLLPPMIGLLALIRRGRRDTRMFIASLGIFAAGYAWCEVRYLGRKTPWRRWLLLPVVALLAPIEILQALASDDEVEWRGQRLRVSRGGAFEVVE